METGRDAGGFWMPPAASTLAKQVDDLYFGIYWISVFFFILVVGLALWFTFKYRRRHPDQRATSQVHHNTRLEVFWTVIPTVLVIVMFVWGFRVFLLQTVTPADALEYQVTAKRWGWDFRDADGCLTPGELHVPAGRPVRLVMRSMDVLHSFFVPDFRVKMDVVPGRYTTLWFEAPEPTPEGAFHQVFCTEYCGTGHSDMLAKVFVHTAEDFEKKAWCVVDADPVVAGERVFNGSCAACHTIDGTPRVGPTMKGRFGGTATIADGTTVPFDENYITESVRVPTAKIAQGFPPAMPPFPQLSDEQVHALVQYIKSLR